MTLRASPAGGVTGLYGLARGVALTDKPGWPARVPGQSAYAASDDGGRAGQCGVAMGQEGLPFGRGFDTNNR